MVAITCMVKTQLHFHDLLRLYLEKYNALEYIIVDMYSLLQVLYD